MKAIILNYTDLSVQVAIIPGHVYESEEMYAERFEKVEEYLTNELGYCIDEINYMTADDDEPIAVYPCGVDTLKTEPIAVL